MASLTAEKDTGKYYACANGGSGPPDLAGNCSNRVAAPGQFCSACAHLAPAGSTTTGSSEVPVLSAAANSAGTNAPSATSSPLAPAGGWKGFFSRRGSPNQLRGVDEDEDDDVEDCEDPLGEMTWKNDPLGEADEDWEM